MCPSADLNANLEVFALRLISSFFVYRDATAHENAMNFWRNHFLFRSFALCVCLLVVVFLFILFFHLQPQILWQPLIMNKQSSSLSLLAQLRSSNKLPDLTSFEFALLLRPNLFSYIIPFWNIYQRMIAFLFKFYANCGRKYFWPFYFVLLSCCAFPFSRSSALTR